MDGAAAWRQSGWSGRHFLGRLEGFGRHVGGQQHEQHGEGALELRDRQGMRRARAERRFDDVVEYHVPSTAEVQALLRLRLAVYVKSKKDLADLSTDATGLSHAEIARAIDDAVKEAVMHDQEIIPTESLRILLQQRQAVRRRTAGGKE